MTTTNNFDHHSNIYPQDAWSSDDEDMTDAWDQSLGDFKSQKDLPAPDLYDATDLHTADEITALEQERDRCLRKGDADGADDAEQELQQYRPVDPMPKRTLVWTPPPQVGRVSPVVNGDIPKAVLTKMHKRPAVIMINKSSPSLAASKSPKPRPDHKARIGPFMRPSKLSDAEDSWTVAGKSSSIQTPKRMVMHAPSKIRDLKQSRRSKSGKPVPERFVMTQEKRETIDTAVKTLTTGKGLQKTRACQHILQGKTCPYGDKCTFAHTPEELTAKSCAFKDACRNHPKGTCKFPRTAEELAAATEKVRAKMKADIASLCCKPCAPTPSVVQVQQAKKTRRRARVYKNQPN